MFVGKSFEYKCWGRELQDVMIVMQGPLGEESCQHALGKEFWNKVARVLCRKCGGRAV